MAEAHRRGLHRDARAGADLCLHLPVNDAVGVRHVAGLEDLELEAVADYVKAEEELDKRSRGGPGLGQRVKEDGDDDEGDPKEGLSANARKKAAAAKKKALAAAKAGRE